MSSQIFTPPKIVKNRVVDAQKVGTILTPAGGENRRFLTPKLTIFDPGVEIDISGPRAMLDPPATTKINSRRFNSKKRRRRKDKTCKDLILAASRQTVFDRLMTDFSSQNSCFGTTFTYSFKLRAENSPTPDSSRFFRDRFRFLTLFWSPKLSDRVENRRGLAIFVAEIVDF